MSKEIKSLPPGILKPLPYEVSDEVQKIAEKVLNGLTIHANIMYVKSYKSSKWLGKCQLVPAVFKLLTGYDYIIYVNANTFAGLSAKQKEALIFHELEHIAWKPNKKDPEYGKWATRPHDCEEFGSVIQKYGRWLCDVEYISKSLDQFDSKFEEQDEQLVNKETGEILYEELEEIMNEQIQQDEQDMINEINSNQLSDLENFKLKTINK